MVDITISSSKYYCNFSIKEKITIIQGDSATGKTELTRQINSEGTNIKVSNGFSLDLLTQDVFKVLLKHKNNSKSWANDLLQSGSIYIIDDEPFVKTHEFAEIVNHDKGNYFIIISRTRLPSLSYSANEIYTLKKKGKVHELCRATDYKKDED